MVVLFRVMSKPPATLWFFTLDEPPRDTSSAPPPSPKAVGPSRLYLAKL